jgi:signal transduction histidine kinase
MLAPATASADQVMARGFWVDTSGVAGLEEAQAATYTPFGTVMIEGFSPHPYWIRLDLPAGQLGGEDWIVRIRPAWHDEIRLYDTLSLGQEWVTGDRYRRSAEAYRSLNLNFRIPQSHQERSLFLRLDSAHSYLLQASVHPISDAIARDQRQFAFLMSYLAFLGFVLLISVITWFSDREQVLGLFCVQLVLAMLYGASIYGVFRMVFDGVISNGALDLINNLLIVAYPTGVLAFYRMFLMDYGVYAWMRQVFLAMMSVAVINVVLILFGVAELALRINNLVLMLATFLIFISPWVLIDHSQKPKQDSLPLWVARLATTGLATAGLVSLANTLGVPLSSNAALNSFLVHPFALAVLISILLQYRARERLKRVTAEHTAASQRVIEERATRETLQQFMGMLSHEIKSPLSVVSLAVDQGIKDPKLLGAAGRAVTDINQLVMRCLQTDQVEAGAFEPRRQRFLFNELVVTCTEGRPELSARVRMASDERAEVRGDVWFSQIILNNLLENALKYGHDGGQIDIALEPKTQDGQDGWVMRVSNAVEARERIDAARIFDKFYRGERAARRSGAGLGLYLSAALASQQGGTLTFNQPQATQVEFELWMPA